MNNIRAVIILTLFTAGSAYAAPEFDPVSRAREEIWAKEVNIYAGRSTGSLNFYVQNASDQYLGWPPTTDAPFPIATLRQGSAAMKGQTHEKIVTTFKGFTLSGTTAVIYYLNHRTALPDGTPTDQYYDNIHVWTREDGVWKILGGMSRLAKK